MKSISALLEELTINSISQFLLVSKNEWQEKSAPNKWSKKEILGHLIDSAANNHQRFVRLQFEDEPVITYDQNEWNKHQNYNEAPLNQLIDLFKSYNLHLAYILKNISPVSENKLCYIKKENPVTLKCIASDYVKHFEHHLKKIIED